MGTMVACGTSLMPSLLRPAQRSKAKSSLVSPAAAIRPLCRGSGTEEKKNLKDFEIFISDQCFLKGEGRNRLRFDISRRWCHQTRRSEAAAGARCEMVGAAMPGDARFPGNNDSRDNFPDKSIIPLSLKIRAICFYLWTYAVGVPLFVVMITMHPFVLVLDKKRRKAHHFLNRIWALVTTSLFYETEVVGRENLPSPNEAAVYVSNHPSLLDFYTLFLLGRPFKFISKTSNFLIPIMGWSMYLTGHVPLLRLDRRSQMDCIKKCLELVKSGVSVLFFPEGTRSGTMAAFKRGAFAIAIKGNVPVVPISVIGTGTLMPNGLESTLRPGKVKVVIHPTLRGDDADELCHQTRDLIAHTLLNHGL